MLQQASEILKPRALRRTIKPLASLSRGIQWPYPSILIARYINRPKISVPLPGVRKLLGIKPSDKKQIFRSLQARMACQLQKTGLLKTGLKTGFLTGFSNRFFWNKPVLYKNRFFGNFRFFPFFWWWFHRKRIKIDWDPSIWKLGSLWFSLE